jgi:hypothetical protein
MSDPGVTVWPDVVGMPWGYGYVDVGGHWMCVPQVATFHLDLQTRLVRAHPHDGALADRVRETYVEGVLPLALQALGLEVLHASAVRMGGGVVALCGVSGTGKSTMADALGRRGYRPCADDAVALDPSEAKPRVIPLPFRMRPRSATGSRADRAAPQRWEQGGDDPADQEPRLLTALFVLTRTVVGAETALSPLTPAAAFSAVLPHAYCFSLDDVSRTRRMLRAYFHLVTSVPVFQIVFAAGLRDLPTILDAVERTVECVRTRVG